MSTVIEHPSVKTEGDTPLVKLYGVTSEHVDLCDRCHDAHVAWFVSGRTAPLIRVSLAFEDYRPAEHLIELYTGIEMAGHVMTVHLEREELLSEFFTNEEAAMLAAYLNRAHGVTAAIEEVHFPLRGSLVPYGDNPTDNGAGFYELFAEPGYDLPLKVRAWCVCQCPDPLCEWFTALLKERRKKWIDAQPTPESAYAN